ncbi:recombinase family protein [Duganella sp. BJB488]|uniref:recombinase family protein n=1 Tax=unclassified Duganella TaxID=2636909 RepID=UPI000E351587|nr:MULTISPECIES: recombinase family protein [unclassified Duganella]RFP23128.1 recombinase family protein [Duganella sp. BJB489]RFP25242.1 recombinase family protein [Duganella sp. BJB488]RFP34126.1 recombinase family protein [Duganella sp. BJB480]
MTNHGYARTSTFDQQYGLDDQIAQLTKAGCDKVFSEQVSATDMDARTQWTALIAGLKAGDVVTITKIDRAARNIADMVGITKKLADIGASIRILDMNIDTTTATGTLMLNIFASVAQFERDQMLVRQRIGIEAAKAKDKTLPLEQRTYKGAQPTARAKAAEVHALLAAGRSKEQIAKALNIGIASVYRILKAAA